MKTILVLLLTACISSSYTIAGDSNKILWSNDYQLQWNDFKGYPQKMEGIEAWTAYFIDCRQEGNKFGIFCYFERNKSWRIKSKENDYLLKHEQYHFNIAEVYARKLRKQMIVSDLKELNKEFNKNYKEMEKVQKAYDKETNHSKNPEEQGKWEIEIDRQLKDLSDFADPFIK